MVFRQLDLLSASLAPGVLSNGPGLSPQPSNDHDNHESEVLQPARAARGSNWPASLTTQCQDAAVATGARESGHCRGGGSAASGVA